jgi:hypothetical protein
MAFKKDEQVRVYYKDAWKIATLKDFGRKWAWVLFNGLERCKKVPIDAVQEYKPVQLQQSSPAPVKTEQTAKVVVGTSEGPHLAEMDGFIILRDGTKSVAVIPKHYEVIAAKFLEVYKCLK